jgi:hypothetical protein
MSLISGFTSPSRLFININKKKYPNNPLFLILSFIQLHRVYV